MDERLNCGRTSGRTSRRTQRRRGLDGRPPRGGRVAAAFGLGLAAAASAGPVRTGTAIRLEAQAAPGTEASFQRFDRGQPVGATSAAAVAFTGDLDGDSAADDVLYAGDRLVLREGQEIPGRGVIVDVHPFDGGHAANTELEVAAVVTVEAEDGSRSEVIIHEQRVVAGSGDPVPDGGGDRYVSFDSVGLLETGQVGFHARTDGPASSDSVIVLAGTVLHRKGGAVPWDGKLFWDGRFDEVTWNGAGDLLFEGNTSGPTASDRVLVRRPFGGADEVVAREGDGIASEKGPVILELIEQAAIGADGSWAARALVRGAPATLDEMIFGPAGVVVREGDPMAGIPGAIAGHFSAVATDDVGRIACTVELDGDRPDGVDQAIVVDGEVATVTGIEARGLPGGTFLASMGFEDLAGTGDGRFVYTATYGGAVSGDGLFSIDAEARCAADLDADGIVGVLDLVVLIAEWGGCPRLVCGADLDGDGAIDMDDVVDLLAVWGACD